MTVEALDDDDAIPDAAFTIGFAASGADYAGVTESFVLTVTEDDSEELVVEPLALEFDEGADGEITVKLASEPAGPVTVRATLDAPDDPSPNRDGDSGDPAVHAVELESDEELHGGGRR